MVTEINENGVGSLKRLADLIEGKFQSQFIESSPPFNFLKIRNCPLEINFVGIFNWRVEPHRTREGRYFVDTKLCVDKIPIEIIIIENCSTADDLRNKLLNGVHFQFSTTKILIVYRTNDAVYQGVLCSENDFKISGDEKKLKAVDLDLFEVTDEDFICVDNKFFYNSLNLGTPLEISYAKNFSDFIKEKIIARANRTKFKNRISKENLNIFCDFIQNFSTKDFYREIAEERFISIDDAQNSVQQFVSANEKFLKSEIFQDEIFENLIQYCPKLLEKFEKIVSEKWYTDNQEKISSADSKLAKIQNQTEEELKNYVELEDEIKILNSQLEKINAEINLRENFVLEIENKIARRIESAKKNAADFICEMAFVNPNFGAVQTSKNNFYRTGKFINGADYEIEDISDFIYTLETEIGIAGTDFENMLSFASYLTAAYMNKILLLLAGPNARDIADAFSVTLTGKTAAIFDCSNVTALEDLEDVLNSDDEIISVLNPFAPNFIAYLPELVNIGGKFIFAIYPFVEDLKMEPRSFYNYFLPVFTELIIDRPPTRNFSTKYFLSDELRQEFKQKYNSDEVPISAEERIKTLKNTAQEISNAKKSAVLFADFPLAYVKGKEEKFIAEFNGDEKILEKMREFAGTDE